MSEVIDYWGEAEGFKDEKEMKDFIKLAWEFQEAEVDKVEIGNRTVVEVKVYDGWRGGGASCEELVEEHFKEWLDKHKNVKFYMNATYTEQAPTETVFDNRE